MKKLILFIAAFFAFLSVKAQITQLKSDSIVLQRMSEETRQHSVHVKNNLQTDFTIYTSQEEILELNYSCWVYYVNYIEQTTVSHYLIVKESNGNILQVNTKNTAEPTDLANWRTIPEEPPLDSLVLIAKGNLSGSEGIQKQNLVITTQTAWDSLITTMNTISNVSDSFTDTIIDFSKYQILTLFDELRPTSGWTIDITNITEYADSIIIVIQNIGQGDTIFGITQPYCIVKIPLSDKPIAFHDETIPTNYPLEVPFMEYILDSSYCNWNFTNFNTDTVYIVNSEIELTAFTTCTGDSIFPTIDFTQYSLLLVRGYADSATSAIAKSFDQISLLGYELNIGTYLNDTANLQEWLVAVVVPKITQNATIALNIMLCENKVPMINYSLDSNWCSLFLNFDTLYIINSNEELFALVGMIPSPIDFTNYTLLCMRDVSPNYIARIDTVLLKNNCTNQYALNIIVYQATTHTVQAWHVAILIPKIPANTDIILNHRNQYPQ